MGKVISIVNRKGGVGKTTLTIGLADTLAYSGASVMVADLDPQASASQVLLKNALPPERVEDEDYEPIIEADNNKKNLPALLESMRSGKSIDIRDFYFEYIGPFNEMEYGLIANSDRLWNLEETVVASGKAKWFESAVCSVMSDLADRFDYVLIDCPPGRTLVSESAIIVSDMLLCPVVPDRLSVWGLETFDRYLQKIAERRKGRKSPKAYYLATRVQRGNIGPKHIQEKCLDEMKGYSQKKRYITLAREQGGKSGSTPEYGILEDDSQLKRRMEGNPFPRRVWRYDTAYSSATASQLRWIVSWMKRELGDG